MIHPGRHPKPTMRGPVHEHGAVVPAVAQLASQRPDQRRRVAWVGRGLDGSLVREQVGLDGGVEPVVQRLDLIADRRENSFGERDQPLRRDPDA